MIEKNSGTGRQTCLDTGSQDDSRMPVRWNDRNVHGSSSALIGFFERQRAVGEEHSLHCQRRRCSHDELSRTFLAHSMDENLAPVSLHLLNQTLKASSHAVILFASSGTRSSLSSSSVLVQSNAATRPPAEVPVTTRGSRSASRKALTTPKLFGQLRGGFGQNWAIVLVIPKRSSAGQT